MIPSFNCHPKTLQRQCPRVPIKRACLPTSQNPRILPLTLQRRMNGTQILKEPLTNYFETLAVLHFPTSVWSGPTHSPSLMILQICSLHPSFIAVHLFSTDNWKSLWFALSLPIICCLQRDEWFFPQANLMMCWSYIKLSVDFHHPP